MLDIIFLMQFCLQSRKLYTVLGQRLEGNGWGDVIYSLSLKLKLKIDGDCSGLLLISEEISVN